jgi:hypothetical protein
MPAVKFFACLDLDQICEGANWCPSISGWTLKKGAYMAELIREEKKLIVKLVPDPEACAHLGLQ